MDTPFYLLCKADPQVLAALGGPEPRIYPFGEAPQKVAKPYAVYSTVGGSPFNMLNGRPTADSTMLQVDVYGATEATVNAAARAIRHALELDSYVVRYNGGLREPETQLLRVSFDVDFISVR